jgi:hypothetical protein
VIAAFRTAFPENHWVITLLDEFFRCPCHGQAWLSIASLPGKMVDSRILMDRLGMMTHLGMIPGGTAAT